MVVMLSTSEDGAPTRPSSAWRLLWSTAQVGTKEIGKPRQTRRAPQI